MYGFQDSSPRILGQSCERPSERSPPHISPPPGAPLFGVQSEQGGAVRGDTPATHCQVHLLQDQQLTGCQRIPNPPAYPCWTTPLRFYVVRSCVSSSSIGSSCATSRMAAT